MPTRQASRSDSSKAVPVTDEFPCLLDRCIHDGRYHLQENLGAGASGAVYRAIDLRSSNASPVAIKCIPLSSHARVVKAREETIFHRLAAKIPGVVGIHNVFEEDGWLFIVLDCYPGDMFTLVIDEKHYVGRDDLIKSVFLQLLDTVQELHRIGIYHRDIKPENVLVNGDGSQVKLADFGLATEYEYTNEFGVGSDYYMSPECISGRGSSALSTYSSRAADIWALGVILINMTTSRSPWLCAKDTDPSFSRYTRNRNVLRHNLPLSKAAFLFVDRIFHNHGDNLDIGALRHEFLKIDTFYKAAAVRVSASGIAPLVIRNCVEGQDEGAASDDGSSPMDLAGWYFPDDDGHPAVGHPTSPRTEQRNATTSHSTCADSEGPITPETHALQVKDVVPDLIDSEEEALRDQFDQMSFANVATLVDKPQHPPDRVWTDHRIVR